ncbi:relaxase domain-containing protein [Sporichthya sp.]|uniref:relaxase domain-containing protein n=1 Tax=Sporichthya sp. TaxID=65475 RepID=UPI0025E3488A|nr:relaxase domain-containing protein [Sporichthya sp.]
MPVRFSYRDRGPRRTPGYELDGISDELLTVFSSRSTEIGAKVQDLVAAFTDTHGSEPDRVQTIRLRQQATLATRPDKHMSPLAELRARWRATAETVTGQPADAIAGNALTSADAGLSSIASTTSATRHGTEISDALLARYAEAAVAGVTQRGAAWTATNLLAEAARTTRALRLPDVPARLALLDRVVT